MRPRKKYISQAYTITLFVYSISTRLPVMFTQRDEIAYIPITHKTSSKSSWQNANELSPALGNAKHIRGVVLCVYVVYIEMYMLFMKMDHDLCPVRMKRAARTQAESRAVCAMRTERGSSFVPALGITAQR